MKLVIVGPDGVGKKRLRRFLREQGVDCTILISENPETDLFKRCDKATLFVGEFIAPREPDEPVEVTP
jgi:hypothetical protein